MGRLVINDTMTVNGALQAPVDQALHLFILVMLALLLG
jgi:hypothetical protein